jgi:high-affinity Fe2+/Pb2+ permease
VISISNVLTFELTAMSAVFRVDFNEPHVVRCVLLHALSKRVFAESNHVLQQFNHDLATTIVNNNNNNNNVTTMQNNNVNINNVTQYKHNQQQQSTNKQNKQTNYLGIAIQIRLFLLLAFLRMTAAAEIEPKTAATAAEKLLEHTVRVWRKIR